MDSSSPHFDQFIRSLHRRFILLRGAERIGLCLLAGCGGAAVVLPVVWWQGGRAWPLVVLILGMASAIGLIMSMVRKPGVLDAAMEADRQLRLADLLGSAWAIRSSGPRGNELKNDQNLDPWKLTLLAMAEARCRSLSPSQVLLHRWGSRAWGGVGLAVCLVTMLSLFVSRSAPSQAATELFVQQDDLGVKRTVDSPSAAYSPVRPVMRQRASDPADDTSAETGSIQTADKTSADKSASANRSSADQHATSAGDPTGSGGGAAATFRPPAALPTIPIQSSASANAGHGPTASGGQADSQTDAGQSSDALHLGVAGARQATAAAPVSLPADAARADMQRALENTRSRPAYDAYRDLIRGYFDGR